MMTEIGGKGIFYVVGTGPGDPELLTIKACRILRKVQVLAVPVSQPMPGCRDEADLSPVYEAGEGSTSYRKILEECAAYTAAARAVPEIKMHDKLFLPMPMKMQGELTGRIHDRDAAAAAELLDAGKDVAFITLGDPSVYSTGSYIQERLEKQGYPVCIVPGIPSFCAAAAKLAVPLAAGREELHILPAAYGVEEGLLLKGTKVLMKAGRKLPEVQKAVREQGQEMWMVQNCGMEGEKIFGPEEKFPENAGYFSLLIVKEDR